MCYGSHGGEAALIRSTTSSTIAMRYCAAGSIKTAIPDCASGLRKNASISNAIALTSTSQVAVTRTARSRYIAREKNKSVIYGDSTHTPKTTAATALLIFSSLRASKETAIPISNGAVVSKDRLCTTIPTEITGSTGMHSFGRSRRTSQCLRQRTRT